VDLRNVIRPKIRVLGQQIDGVSHRASIMLISFRQRNVLLHSATWKARHSYFGSNYGCSRASHNEPAWKIQAAAPDKFAFGGQSGQG
jgi:hypothetical protein